MKGAAQPVPTAPSEPFSLGRLCRWTWQMIRPELSWFILSACGALVMVLGGQFQTQVMGAVVSQLAAQVGNVGPGQSQTGKASSAVLGGLIPADLSGAAALMVGVIVFLTLFSYAVKAIEEFANNRMLERLQLTLHDKFLRLGPEWHDRKDAGNSTMVVNQIARGVQPLLRQVAQYPIVQGIGLVSALSLIYLNLGALPATPPIVRVIGVAILLVVPVVAWKLSSRVRAAYDRVLDAESRVSTDVLNSLAQPTDMQALGAERQRSRRVAERLHVAAEARLRMGLRSDLSTGFMTALPLLMQAMFLVYGVLVTIETKPIEPAAIGAILVIYQFVPNAVSPLLALINFFTGLNTQWPAVVAVGEVLDAKPAISDRPDAGPWPEGPGRFAVAGLRFAYSSGGPDLLNGIDHQFAPERITAIVGRAGCGKSTILQLIMRLREPSGGTLEVDGTPFARISLDALRRHIVMVSQVSPFLTDTVRENFLLAAAEASDADIEQACRQTGFWEVLVNKQPTAPLDLPVTREAGKILSGGERRLLAVTRALLRQPSILLLDEPTTGVDMLHLKQVADALRAVAKGCTTVLIEHNLDFVLGLADEVCVLDGGRFVQVGPPSRLAQEPGLFRELLETRRRLAESGEGMTVEAHPMPSLEAKPPASEVPMLAVGARKKAFAP
jgi:ABC-type multidrug transport system fused ATPase/permease subunit